jgi:hypothetical protein
MPNLILLDLDTYLDYVPDEEELKEEMRLIDLEYETKYESCKEFTLRIEKKSKLFAIPEPTQEEINEEVLTMDEKMRWSKRRWYIKNHEKIKEYRDKYVAENKEKLRIQKKESYDRRKEELHETFICLCGRKTSRAGFNKHINTKIHQRLYIEKLKEQNIQDNIEIKESLCIN